MNYKEYLLFETLKTVSLMYRQMEFLYVIFEFHFLFGVHG